MACPVTCKNNSWNSSTKRVCVCVVSVFTFPPTIIQSQKTTQNTNFFRNRTCFWTFHPQRSEKNQPWVAPFFCCKCLPTDGLWPRWSRLSSQTPALVHVNWLKSITGWLELNHVSLWKDLLKICAICGKLAGTITHWICSGVSRLCFFMPQIMRSTAHGENGQHLTKLEGPALGPTHTLWLIGKCKSSSLNNGKGRGTQDIQNLYLSTQ